MVTARPEVQLHLLRHAHAGDPAKWQGSDDVRPLSEKGRLQAERLGIFLAHANFEPDAIVSSPRLRAIETARLVAAPLGVAVRVDDALGEPLDIETLEALLRSWGDPRRPVVVGHDPDFSQIAADLTGIAELPVRKGALVRIDLQRPIEAGAGLLRWLLPPELLAVTE
jgi:phosphohistidine phosphatase SixA